jgi:hypothetical protein
MNEYFVKEVILYNYAIFLNGYYDVEGLDSNFIVE